jgi:hypothetical protein
MRAMLCGSSSLATRVMHIRPEAIPCGRQAIASAVTSPSLVCSVQLSGAPLQRAWHRS